MRTKTPAQHEAEYNWLTPSEVAELIDSDAGTVRAMIQGGEFEAMDISRSQRRRYRISPASVDAFLGTRAASAEAERIHQAEASRAAVYVVEAVGVDRVKIGYSTHVRRRMVALRTACPVPIRLVSAWEADPEFEQRLHAALAEHRTHGEWFELAAAEKAATLMKAWLP